MDFQRKVIVLRVEMIRVGLRPFGTPVPRSEIKPALGGGLHKLQFNGGASPSVRVKDICVEVLT